MMGGAAQVLPSGPCPAALLVLFFEENTVPKAKAGFLQGRLEKHEGSDGITGPAKGRSRIWRHAYRPAYFTELSKLRCARPRAHAYAEATNANPPG